MAVQDKRDKPFAEKRRDWINKNFGANEHGMSFGKQMLLALPDAYTMNSFTKRPQHKDDFTRGERKILIGLGGTITAMGTAFVGALPLSVIHSNGFYDASVVPHEELSESLIVNGETGSLTITNGEDIFMLHKDAEGGYQLYTGHEELSGDITFTLIANPVIAAYQSMQIVNDFEALNKYSDANEIQSYNSIVFEGISGHFQEEAGGSVLVGGDEPNIVQNDLSLSGVSSIFEEAETFFSTTDHVRISDDIEIRDNDLVAPGETFSGMVAYYFAALGLLGGFGVATSFVNANRSSRKEYQKKKTHKPS